jgi:hypothetical protein
MGTTQVQTDASLAYLKAMGNRQGPHALAAEFVGSSLAQWFRLAVADFALFTLPAESCFDLPRNARTHPGPAFVSRHVEGRTWGGTVAELRELDNPGDVTRLVVFDTWVRNCDRHPPDLNTRRPNYANVYLGDTDRPAHPRLFAIDHTHCFDCGRDLTRHLANIDLVRDNRTYGLFPSFVPYLDPGQLVWCGAMLRSLQADTVRAIVDSIPPEWDVPADARAALTEQILKRATFVATRIDNGWPLAPTEPPEPIADNP